jgi:hypothetical protein
VRRGARIGLAVLALSLALGASEARAFVRSTTGNSPFFWKESCVPVTIYLNNFDHTSGMTQDQIVKSVTAAAHSWSTDAVTCRDPATMTVTGSPYLEIVPSLAPASTAPPAVAWDAKNSIIFRTEQWSKSGQPGHVYPPEALAVTTVTARSDGHIVDADMEVNGVTQVWMNFDPGVTPPFDQGETMRYFDLQNALTHEFGHFIGLDHTCFIPSIDNPLVSADGKPRPTDNAGAPVPDCDASPAKIQGTVMFNVTVPEETSKRYLSDDDILAVCTIYAPTMQHDACALDSANPGCAVAAPRPARARERGWALGLSTAAAVAAALSARRRARRT